MERYQQFSTPLPLGHAALAAGRIGASDHVLEPSAGTGLLAILGEIAGGSLALNELAETRADLLRLLFPGSPVTCFDAAQIDDYLDAHLRPSVILMNPPFSALANVDGRTTTATARHIRSALARLAPGGRLVAITGASFAPDVPAWVETFASLTESAHLVFTGAVSGAAFAKHGTSFETRISVFDKCRGSEAGGITADLTRPIGPDVTSLLSLITALVPPRLTLETPVLRAQTPLSLFPENSAHAMRTANGRSHATSATATTSTALQAFQRETYNGDCNSMAVVRHGSYGMNGQFRWRNGSVATLPSMFRGVEGYGQHCTNVQVRAVFVDWNDYEGAYAFEQVNY